MKLDEKDKRILELLKKNARITNTEISKKVKLTEGAVRNRINRLLRKKVVNKFTVEVTKGDQYAIVLAKAKRDTKKMMREIAKSGIPKESYEISGDFDGCLIVEGYGIEEIDSKIDKLRKLGEIKETKTLISLKRWI